MLLEKIKLEPGEKILTQSRRHWFIIMSKIATLIMLAGLPLLALFSFRIVLDTQEIVTLSFTPYFSHLSYLYVVWLLLIWIAIFNTWTNYYLDILTITNRRVVLINQKGFFRRNISSFRLERLQDMHIEINGFIATILDYGSLLAETAGHAEEEFKATSMPHPRDLKAMILREADNRIPTTPKHTESL